MDMTQLFLMRYDVLYDFYLAGIWDTVPQDLMRQRPHPRVNSIAWILWHLTRVEDAGLNRFVMDGSQVLDEGNWMQRMNVPWRHNGSEMTLSGVDELNQMVDLPALRDYSQAVQVRTREILANIDQVNLEATLQEPYVRKVIVEEGLGYTDPEGFIQNYTGWSKGKCLMTYGLTHPFQHLGEIETIASLLGVVFE
ncbi:MAG: DinB family protein [Chloroflexota bacterium]